MTGPAGKIHAAIVAVMRDLGAISKGRRNTVQGYQFRGIDDVYNEIHDVLAQHGVFTVPAVLSERTEDRTTGKGSALIYRVLTIRYTFFADDGSSLEAVVIGEGMDSGDKASNKAMSVAHKYALVQVFAIPTEESKDPENDSHQVKAKAAPRPATTRAPEPTTPAPEPVGYDPNNTSDRAKLHKILGARKISQENFAAVSMAMKGKLPRDLDGVLAGLKLSPPLPQ